MGAGASSKGHADHMEKPIDAADIASVDAAKEELARLNATYAEDVAPEDVVDPESITDLESGKAAVIKARELIRSRDGEANGAATKLQSKQRGKNAAKYVETKKAEVEEKKEMDGAATKLQAVQRGKNATKEVEAKKAAAAGTEAAA